MTTTSPAATRHCLAILVTNEPGALARVIGLFSGRGYNIESLAVAEVDSVRHLSRISIVTTGTEDIVMQIKAQLRRLVPVHRVLDLTTGNGSVIERDLVLTKVQAEDDAARTQALAVAKAHGAIPVGSQARPLVFMLAAAPAAVDLFLAALKPLGLTEVSRSGTLGLSSSRETIA